MSRTFLASRRRDLNLLATDLRARKRVKKVVASGRLARSVLEQMADAVVVCDAEQRVISANNSAKELCASNPVGMLFERAFPLVPAIDPHARSGVVARAMSGEVLRGLLASLVRVDGSRAQLLVSAKPLRYSVNRISGCVVTMVEAIEYRDAGLALREREEQLRRVARAGRVGLFEWNMSQSRAYWSPEVRELFGTGQRCEPTSKQWLERVHPQDRERMRRHLQGVIESSLVETGSFCEEYRMLHDDGTVLWLEATIALERDQYGHAIMRGMVRNVTERIEADKERERLVEQLRVAQKQLVADLDAMTWLQKLGSRLLREVNFKPVFSEIVEAAINIAGADFGCIHTFDFQADCLQIVAQQGLPDCWQQFWNRVEKGHGACGVALERGERVVVEDVEQSTIFAGTPALEIQLQAGVRAVQCTPLLSRSGLVLGMLSTHYRKPVRPNERSLRLLDLLARQAADIIERVQSEEALRQANAQLLDADRRKNRFLAMLSHELRNPLAPIKNSIFILGRAEPGGDQALRAQAVIERQTEQLARLVDDLLDVTRITQNKIQLHKQRLDLNELVRRTIDDHRALFDKNGIALESKLAPQPLHVTGDRNRLTQVIGNLLHNCAKFTDRKGVTRVSVTADADKQMAVISVTDSGVGITPQMLSQLFEPFSQADETLDRSKGGLGLGLALVKGLVELHGGEIVAHSSGLSRGSEFVISLPLDSQPAVQRSGHQGREGSRGSRRRVLIIEDNVDAADSLSDALGFGKHVVEVAYNGPQGLAKAREFRPDVVLCDIGLPGMDGYDVARALHSDRTVGRAFLVALSGYALPEDLQRAQEAGFERHMAKPPNLDKLEALIEEAPVLHDG